MKSYSVRVLFLLAIVFPFVIGLYCWQTRRRIPDKMPRAVSHPLIPLDTPPRTRLRSTSGLTPQEGRIGSAEMGVSISYD